MSERAGGRKSSSTDSSEKIRPIVFQQYREIESVDHYLSVSLSRIFSSPIEVKRIITNMLSKVLFANGKSEFVAAADRLRKIYGRSLCTHGRRGNQLAQFVRNISSR